jgi:hypothetical protein
MSAPPAWFSVEALLVAFDAFPADKVRPIVLADRFNYVIGFAITLLAAMNVSIQ